MRLESPSRTPAGPIDGQADFESSRKIQLAVDGSPGITQRQRNAAPPHSARVPFMPLGEDRRVSSQPSVQALDTTATFDLWAGVQNPVQPEALNLEQVGHVLTAPAVVDQFPGMVWLLTVDSFGLGPDLTPGMPSSRRVCVR